MMAPESKSSLASPSAVDASDALTAVVNSATAVVRAELQLAAVEAKAWLTRIGIGLALVWLSLSLILIFVLLLALTPVLAENHQWPILAVMLALSLLPTVGVSWLAWRELRRVKEPIHAGKPRHDH